MKEQILAIVVSALEEINRTRKNKIDCSDPMDLALYGSGGVFDSMQLVNFLVLVEQKIDDEMSQEISLTSEKAVSMRVSPFASVRRLIDFIADELSEAKTEAA
jgi:acyl carrier protein